MSDRPLFVGNLEPDARVKDLEKIFSRYGEVKQVDLKVGFAFVYLDGDVRRAIREEDDRRFMDSYRRLRVQLAKGDGDVKRREERRKKEGVPPNETLFVVNFDPRRVVERDLEDLFGKYGRLRRVDIKKNFAFVEFESVLDSEAAMKALDGYKLHERALSVEYQANSGPRGGGDSGTKRERSPPRRSPSPPRRPRGSPVYDRYERSPSPQRRRTSRSRSRSPAPRR